MKLLKLFIFLAPFYLHAQSIQQVAQELESKQEAIYGGFFVAKYDLNEFKRQAQYIQKHVCDTKNNDVSTLRSLNTSTLTSDLNALAKIQRLSYERFKRACNPVRAGDGSQELCYDESLVNFLKSSQRCVRDAFVARTQIIETQIKKKDTLTCPVTYEPFGQVKDIFLIPPGFENITVADYTNMRSMNPSWDFSNPNRNFEVRYRNYRHVCSIEVANSIFENRNNGNPLREDQIYNDRADAVFSCILRRMNNAVRDIPSSIRNNDSVAFAQIESNLRNLTLKVQNRTLNGINLTFRNALTVTDPTLASRCDYSRIQNIGNRPATLTNPNPSGTGTR